MSSQDGATAVGGAPHAPASPDAVPCAGGLVFDARGRLLLIRRGTPPAQGSWSVPGGRVEAGETVAEACVREVAEETGLTVRVLHLAGRVYRDGPGGVLYAIDDFVCEPLGGTLHAATDAADARWVDAAQYRELDEAGALAPLLTAALTEWGALPRR
ncbi:NUDIX hydrolase [Jatrophihabitans sp. YIM 134969]